MTEADKANEGREEKSADAYISKDLFTKMINSEVIVFANDVEYVRKDVAVMIMENYANHKTEPLRDQLSKEREKVKSLERWKKEEMEVWGPVLDYMQDGGSGKRGPIGSSISELVLQILKHHYEGKEREMIKELVDALTFSSKIIDSLIAKATELDKK